MSTEFVTQNNAVVTRPTKRSIQEHLEGPAFREAVAKALPKHLSPERFIRVAITAMTKTPKLLQCTPESFFNCLLSLSQYGLEPDGRRAHLIPYGDQCTLLLDWKGIAELVMRSGLVSYLHADVVCENDVFDYDRGEITAHKIDFRKPRGEVFAVYATCAFKDGTKKSDVMSIADVRAIQKRSRAGQSGPWITDFNEMAKKTVFRRLSKWLPLSAEIRDATEADDDVIDIAGPAPLEIKKPMFSAAPASLPAGEIPGDPPPQTEAKRGPGRPKKEPQNVTPPAETAKAEAAAPVGEPEKTYTPEERQTIINALQNQMIDASVTESKLWGYCLKAKLVPEGIDDLYTLPTAILAKLAPAVKALSAGNKPA